MDAEPTAPQDDAFGPPAEPCDCWCMHCNRIFSSTGIWWQKHLLPGGGVDGMWLCPTPNCDGAGFTFDIFPTDPEHPANGGWHDDDDDDDDDDEDDDDGLDDADLKDDDSDAAGDDAPYDPDEPQYAALDDEAAAHGDVEGEEWKHGLVPGDRPPEPAWAEQARAERQREEARYDVPDERPRVIDESHLPAPAPPPPPPGAGEEEDVPF